MYHLMRQDKEFLIGILSRGCQTTARFDSQIRAFYHRGNATPLSSTCGGLGLHTRLLTKEYLQGVAHGSANKIFRFGSRPQNHPGDVLGEVRLRAMHC